MQKATINPAPSPPLQAPLKAPSEKPTIETLVMASLPKDGTIFFPDEVRLKDVPQKQVRFILAKLAREGSIIRLAWGIYIRPALGDVSKKALLPSPETIAETVARKSFLQIIPSGARAARKVGLLGNEVEDAYEWFVLGVPRQIRLINGKTIKFLMTKEARLFAFKDERMRDLSNGIRYLGKFNIGAFEVDAIRVYLKEIPEEAYKEDLELCPEWVREILEECRH